MSRAAADRSGGLRWHGRALIRRHALWKPFREALAAFLARWQPATRSLILVGPSAGWCLPDTFLSRFDRIIAVDPDFWAPLLFRRLHPHARLVDWIRADFFVQAPELLAREPDAALLFCNVLGQLRFAGLSDAEITTRLASLPTLLAGHPWASYHELLSGETDLTPRALPLAGTPFAEALLRQLGLSGEWLDHGAGSVLPPMAARDIVPWRFAPERLHLVEMGIGGERGRLTARPS